MAGTLRAEFRALSATRAEVLVRRCAAFEGAKRADLARTDQACVACEGLWAAWLGTLLPETQVKVDYPARMGMGDNHCSFHIETKARLRETQ
jgi:hypothetical protein